jgi:hypothetical protein
MSPFGQAEAGYPSTPSGRDKPGSIVVLPLHVQLPSYFPGAGRYVLGPAEMSGSVIAGAKAEFASPIDQWAVDITFTKAGSAQFASLVRASSSMVPLHN